ncbi:MAG: acyl-CoA/acyl-ACP dehydrogenase [Methylobacterium mesophilicum]|nr:acyl-CoA/acyl-ACP dehydrogenase [Methylobacterium mesophilicum]
MPNGDLDGLVGGLDRPSLPERVARVVGIAAKHAAEVDHHQRFPREALDALRAERLMSIAVPTSLGGEGLDLMGVIDVCYGLGKGCGSAGLIFAMHQASVACMVRHGAGVEWYETLLKRLCAEQLLVASSTTEGESGGNIRSSAAALLQAGDAIHLTRDAAVISYGAQADVIVTLARRREDGAASDQVLAAFTRENCTLQAKGNWDTLGMRGTCSGGFVMQAEGSQSQVLPAPYALIHAETMLPVAHLLWSAVWAGIAAAALERAQAFTRNSARRNGGAPPPGARRFPSAIAKHRTLRALIASAATAYQEALRTETLVRSIGFQTDMALFKVEASEMAIAIVLAAMRVCGLAGYRNDGAASVTRHLRDILSSPLMISNDRILVDAGSASLFAPIAASVFE